MVDRATLAAIVAVCEAVAFGQDRCAPCHPNQTRVFQGSPMGRSFQRVSGVGAEFQAPVQFVHVATGRRYRVFRQGDAPMIEEFVANAYADSRRVAYGIGSGSHARSFLAEWDGRYFQAPVTYYARTKRWEMSPGYDNDRYVGFSREVTASCLYCHTDGGSRPAAIGCERCHGPVLSHLARPSNAIVNPGKLVAAQRQQVCDQCHLMAAARVVQPGKSLSNYRAGDRLEDTLSIYGFDTEVRQTARVTGHPEQMRRSRCYRESGDRMWCGTCHDVHATAVTNYRQKCLGCHQVKDCPRQPAGDSSCVGCHMPKLAVAESAHVTFTDHEIVRKPAPRTGPKAETVFVDLKPLLTAKGDYTVELRNYGFASLDAAGSTGRSEYLQRAVETLETIVETRLADGPFWVNLGEGYLQLRQFEKAEAAFRRAVELDPKSAGAQYGLGYLLQSRRAVAEALEAYGKAVALDPQKREAWANMASGYLALGKTAEAASALENALRLEPGNLAWRSALQKMRREAVVPRR